MLILNFLYSIPFASLFLCLICICSITYDCEQKKYPPTTLYFALCTSPLTSPRLFVSCCFVTTFNPKARKLGMDFAHLLMQRPISMLAPHTTIVAASATTTYHKRASYKSPTTVVTYPNLLLAFFGIGIHILQT